MKRSGTAASSLLAAGAVLVAANGVACSNTAAEGTVGVYRADAVVLSMVVRDFKRYQARDATTNPAFHNPQVSNSELDVVADVLGGDGKPVYKTPTNSLPTFGKDFFDQWFHDVPGTNVAVTVPLSLALNPEGLVEYDSRKTGTLDLATGTARRLFFPIDDGTPYMTAFGQEGDMHNFAFTGELHARFIYPGNGVFRFRSDDDLYVFIDGKLVPAASAPGQHVALERMVDAQVLGLTEGRDYQLDVFYAERAGAAGDFMMATTVPLRSAP